MTLVRCKESAGNLSCSHEMRLRRGWRGRNTKHGGAGLSAHRPPPLEKTACVHRLRQSNRPPASKPQFSCSLSYFSVLWSCGPVVSLSCCFAVTPVQTHFFSRQKAPGRGHSRQAGQCRAIDSRQETRTLFPLLASV